MTTNSLVNPGVPEAPGLFLEIAVVALLVAGALASIALTLSLAVLLAYLLGDLLYVIGGGLTIACACAWATQPRFVREYGRPASVREVLATLRRRR